ncbi:hypothetical protein VTN96DRAFT_460 [Rasamsonia emersonii]
MYCTLHTNVCVCIHACSVCISYESKARQDIKKQKKQKSQEQKGVGRGVEESKTFFSPSLIFFLHLFHSSSPFVSYHLPFLIFFLQILFFFSLTSKRRCEMRGGDVERSSSDIIYITSHYTHNITLPLLSPHRTCNLIPFFYVLRAGSKNNEKIKFLILCCQIKLVFVDRYISICTGSNSPHLILVLFRSRSFLFLFPPPTCGDTPRKNEKKRTKERCGRHGNQ